MDFELFASSLIFELCEPYLIVTINLEVFLNKFINSFHCFLLFKSTYFSKNNNKIFLILSQ